MKNLVIYYSRKGENYVNGKIKNIDKGNTEYIAEFLKEDLGADLFKAETIKEYSKSYMDCIREAQKELSFCILCTRSDDSLCYIHMFYHEHIRSPYI